MVEEKTYEIPKECWAGVVKNEGPDFEVEVRTASPSSLNHPHLLTTFLHR